MKRVIIFIALVTLVTSAASSQAAVFCKKKNGNIFVREVCKKKETQLDLSTFGALGPRGPSDAFFTSGTNTLAFVENTAQTVASLNLPAGNWVITAKVVANNNDGVAHQYGCSLLLGGTVIDKTDNLLDIGTVADRDVATLTAAGTLAVDGTADVVCQTDSPSGNWLNRTITAIQVETLK